MKKREPLAMHFAGYLRRRFGMTHDPLASEKPLALVLDDVYPRIDRDSGSLSIVSYMQLLADSGYQIVFAATGEFTAPSLYREQLEASGVICVGPEQFPSIDELLVREGIRFEICFLCRYRAGGLFFETARRHCKSAKIIFDVVDLHHLRNTRGAKLRGDESRKNVIAERKARELNLVRMADASIVVSSFEKQVLDKEISSARVWHIPLIRDYQGRAQPFHGRFGIGFIGNFGHLPNCDAVRYFLAVIWPLVRERLSVAQFFIIGPDMPEDLAKLSIPGVVIVGHVPDLSKPLGKLLLTVAPLRYGAGAKGKVITSLVHGVPCVASEIAAEGMDLVDGKHVLIGHNPAHFAEQIFRLHENERLWNLLSDSGLAIAIKNHSYEEGRARMRSLLASLYAAKFSAAM